jgi:hypothetical protein
MAYAENTKVSAEKSRSEMESTLRRYGAEGFSYGYEGRRAQVSFKADGRIIRFELVLPDQQDDQFTKYKRGFSTFMRDKSASFKLWEQATRQKWRALALVVKAKLEAVDAGISEFEEEFLAHIVLPDNTTIGQWVRPQIQKAYETGSMPRLLGNGQDEKGKTA